MAEPLVSDAPPLQFVGRSLLGSFQVLQARALAHYLTDYFEFFQHRIIQVIKRLIGKALVSQNFQPHRIYCLSGSKLGFELLANAWKNPYNRREIEEYIRAWLMRKLKKRSAEEAMVV